MLKTKLQYSDQQLEIINLPRSLLRRTIVEAYSGCGKSTVLIGLAVVRIKMGFKVLYLGFNRSIVMEAKRKFPKEVLCKTMHGLAYATYGLQYSERLAEKIAPADFAPYLVGLAKSNDELLILSYHSLATFENWCNSPDESPGYEHLSPAAQRAIDEGVLKPEVIIDAACEIVAAMYRPGEAPVSHSFYLKLYQLSRPRIPADTIMVDEAQDLNPVVLAILSYQDHAEVIKVGDKHQSIYEFRGADNGLVDPEAHRLFLTTTYRFGQNLADLATQILVNHKGAKLPLIGNGSKVLIDDYTDSPEMAALSKNPLVIARTKSGILEILINRLLCDNPAKVWFPGGSKGEGFSQLVDAYMLMSKNISRGAMSQYTDWHQYCEIQAHTGDQNASTIINLVERYNGAVPAAVFKLKEHEVSKASKADLCLVTAHKSKGLEHPFVMLANDFPDFCDGEKMPISEQEINLAYVALTRAENAIHLSSNVKKLIQTKELMRGITRSSTQWLE